MVNVKENPPWLGDCKYCGQPILKFNKLTLFLDADKSYKVKRFCIGCGKKITIRDLVKQRKISILKWQM